MNDAELQEIADRQDIDLQTLMHERREVQFLEQIAGDPVLATALAFKGGTALRLVYGCDRYSDDLDFDIVRSGTTPQEILRRLQTIANTLTLEVTDAWVKRRTILLEIRDTGWRRKLKIEVSSLLRSARVQTVVKNIVTPVYPASVNVLTYGLPTLLAGKIRAVIERRNRTPRDLYDLFWLLSRGTDVDGIYLRVASGESVSKTPRGLAMQLQKAVSAYDGRQIRSELGSLLPRHLRAWTVKSLKERTSELIALKFSEQ